MIFYIFSIIVKCLSVFSLENCARSDLKKENACYYYALVMAGILLYRKKGVDRLQTIRYNSYNLIYYYDNIVALHSGKAIGNHRKENPI